MMFRKKGKVTRVAPPQEVSTRFTAGTTPIATLPNGARVTFQIGFQTQQDSRPSIEFDWNPATDPESFVDVALDELYYALDFTSNRFEGATQNQHDFVSRHGGVHWSPQIGRSSLEPRIRIKEEFGDEVIVLASVYGALRQGLKMFSLHLTEKNLYVMSEGSDEYRHCMPLANFLATNLAGNVNWNVVEHVPDPANQEIIPHDERMAVKDEPEQGASDLRSIGFFKVNSTPGWDVFSEMLVRQAAANMPSVISTFQVEPNPPVEVCFLRTAKGVQRIPLSVSDHKLVASKYAHNPLFIDWMKAKVESLPPRDL